MNTFVHCKKLHKRKNNKILKFLIRLSIASKVKLTNSQRLERIVVIKMSYLVLMLYKSHSCVPHCEIKMLFLCFRMKRYFTNAFHLILRRHSAVAYTYRLKRYSTEGFAYYLKLLQLCKVLKNFISSYNVQKMYFVILTFTLEHIEKVFKKIENMAVFGMYLKSFITFRQVFISAT